MHRKNRFKQLCYFGAADGKKRQINEITVVEITRNAMSHYGVTDALVQLLKCNAKFRKKHNKMPHTNVSQPHCVERMNKNDEIKTKSVNFK